MYTQVGQWQLEQSQPSSALLSSTCPTEITSDPALPWLFHLMHQIQSEITVNISRNKINKVDYMQKVQVLGI